MEDALEVLRGEFGSEPGSFLLRLYADLEWDRDAFSRLAKAMQEICEQYASRESLDRWLAEGFYNVATWVPAHTAHINFPQPEPENYYRACLTRLQDLTDWFFRGFHLYQEPHHWERL